MAYFETVKSAYHSYESTRDVIQGISRKYMADNPAVELKYVLSSEDDFRLQSRQIYNLDLSEKYPEAQIGDWVYIAGRYVADNKEQIVFPIELLGKVQIWLNGEMIYKSNSINEMSSKQNESINLNMHAGNNYLLIKAFKTKIGFGCRLRVSVWQPHYFFAPFKERNNYFGFIWSELIHASLFDSVCEGFNFEESEEETDLVWYPDIHWSGAEEKNAFMRLFPENKYGEVVSYSIFECNGECLKLTVYAKSETCVYVDGEKAAETISGRLHIVRELSCGSHSICLVSKQKEGIWGATVESNIKMNAPGHLKGKDAAYLGVLECGQWENYVKQAKTEEILSFDKLHQTKEGVRFWCVDAPKSYIRPLCSQKNFGRWNYPLGVTLYGMIQAGRELDSAEILEYVQKHIEQCIRPYKLSKYLYKKAGIVGLNEQMMELICLDFCGSFGSCMLELYQNQDNQVVREIADEIADYIKNRLERIPDGTFYRDDEGFPVKETLWADDLYMSIPFLCRYHLLTGEEWGLEEAVKQIISYWNYLFIPEKQLLSHVYDFVRNQGTEVCWGRGNGWFIFSLAELLTVLPQTHEKRKELVHIFTVLAKGFLSVQAEDGMWRQVLDREDSYKEASGTSMIIYAFARALHRNWIEEEVLRKQMLQAACKGVRGLKEICIDNIGNIYGVAAGSYFSYDEDYYAKDLQWRLNDTHGIGIVLLALYEYLRLNES